MAKYKVLEEGLNINGIVYKTGAIIDLDYQRANLKSIQGKIEKVPDNMVPKDDSVIGNIIPGVPLTPEQKEKLAKENAEATAEAHRLAAEARDRDQVEGKAEPVVKIVADSLKEKLENQEFEKKENLPPTDTLPQETNPNDLP